MRGLQRGIHRPAQALPGWGDGDGAALSGLYGRCAPGAHSQTSGDQTDETDHQAIIADLLLEAVAGESADQEELVPGVE